MWLALPCAFALAPNDTFLMFIEKMTLDIPKEESAQTSEEIRLKAAFMMIYRQVDGDGNDKINFEEFAKWIVNSITGFDEFFQSFVCVKARSEKPPLYVNFLAEYTEPFVTRIIGTSKKQ